MKLIIALFKALFMALLMALFMALFMASTDQHIALRPKAAIENTY